MSFGDELFYGFGMGAAIILTCSLFPLLAETIASAIRKIK